MEVFGIINKYCRGDNMNYQKFAIKNLLLLILFSALWTGINIYSLLMGFILNGAIAFGGYLTIEFIIITFIKEDLLDKKHSKETAYYVVKAMYIVGALGIPIFFIGVIIQIVDLFK